jgi:4-amino-4-deoxy-L-arabinose transferase-like glycosyltransferase
MNRDKAHTIAVFLLLLLGFGYMSFYRLIATDEGFYLSAAKLWIQGKSIYFDFFFPQTPLMPWVYGLWMKIFGISWESARVFSALLSALCGVLVFNHLLKYGKKTAWLSALLFLTHSLVFSWLPIAKASAITVLFLLGSYVLIENSNSPGSRIDGRVRFALAGLLFGFSIESRLFFAGLGPLMLFLCYQKADSVTGRLSSIISFCVGGTVALSPCIFMAIKDFDIFWFNNMGYHLLRDDSSEEAQLSYKVMVFQTIFGLRDAAQIEGFQFPMLFILASINELLCWRKNKQPTGGYLIAIGLLVLNFTPTPAYVQYFCTVVPFLVIGAAPLISKLHLVPLGIFIATYLFFIPQDFERYTKTGVGILDGDAPNKTLRSLSEIGAAISKEVPAGAKVATDWPGLLIDSHADFYPKLENHFGKRVARRFHTNKREKYKIATIEEIRNFIYRSATQYILIEDRDQRVFNSDVRKNLRGFEFVWHLNGSTLYRRIKNESEKSQ